jgi:hypothetical protein
MGTAKFEIIRPFTIEIILRCDPCIEEIKDVLEFLMDRGISSFDQEIPRDVAKEGFEENSDWLEFAIEKDMVKEVLTEIDEDYLYKDLFSDDLYNIILDDYFDIVTLLNISKSGFRSAKFLDIENSIDLTGDTEVDPKESLEGINSYFKLDLQKTDKKLKDVIYQKYVNK